MTAKTVCLVTHVCRKQDGQGRVIFEIAKAALAAGWRVIFIGAALAPELQDSPNMQWVKFRPARLPSALLRYQVFALQSACWLWRHAGQADIIHVNGFITWHRADVNTAHFVHAGFLRSGYFSHRLSLRGLYRSAYALINAVLERGTYGQATRITAVSAGIAAQLRAIGVPGARIAVIPNGVDTEEFHPGPMLPYPALPACRPLFLFAGDLRTPRKNLDTVLRALALVPGAHLAVAGGTAGSPYPALAAALGVAGRVHFLGHVTDMPALMNAADVFVSPSRYEPFSLVILEAMAAGLPVITARTAGMAARIGDAGRVLDDPQDRDTLAGWMRELAASSSLRIAMGARARQIAETLSWRAMAASYLRLYDEILAA